MRNPLVSHGFFHDMRRRVVARAGSMRPVMSLVRGDLWGSAPERTRTSNLLIRSHKAFRGKQPCVSVVSREPCSVEAVESTESRPKNGIRFHDSFHDTGFRTSGPLLGYLWAVTRGVRTWP